MKRTCSYCGMIVDSNHICSKKPKKNNTLANKFRSTRQWYKKSIEIKERDHYLDQYDLKVKGIYTYDNLEVHHIEPLNTRYDLRLENDNLITLSYKNHKLAEMGKISKELLKSLIPPYIGQGFFGCQEDRG